jgi:hypothetical protein
MTTAIPDSPSALLRRKATADALTAAGYPVSEKTLATKAVRGGGPIYQVFGRTVLYRWADALSWAEGRLSAPRRSTSEADAAKRVA